MDAAHDWTDGQIEALAKKFEGVYGEAARDMRESLETHLASFERENAKWSKLVESGAQTQANYDAWKRAQATRTDYLHGMVDRLATDATRANQKALDMVNDRIPRVYAENANFGAYQVESGLGFDTHSFDLYDESTVRRLMATTEHDQIIHEVIPVGPARPDLQSLRVDLDAAKDVQWNRQKFTAAVTQSILQGESIPNAAKRLMGVLNMDKGMATRAARTAMTGAENAGRVDSYKRAKAMGIELEQEWMATLDERTRYSHRQLDGQHVPVGKKFEVEGHEIEFPGDPKAHPSETYNCRCTLVAWLPGIEKEDPKRWSRLPEGMSYDEWKSGKLAQSADDDLLAVAGKASTKRFADIGTAPVRPQAKDFDSPDELSAARAEYRRSRAEFQAKRGQLVDDIVAAPSNGYETKEKVLAWAERRGVAVADNVFDAVDPRVIDVAVSTNDALMSKYPEVARMYESVGSKYSMGIAPDVDGVFMEASGGLQFGRGLTSDYRKAVESVVDNYTRSTYSEELGRDLTTVVRGEGSLATSVTHEFGHNLDASIRGRLDIVSGEAARYERELVDLTKKFTTSEYATVNDVEAFAEGFAEMECNPTSAYAKAFAEFLARWR